MSSLTKPTCACCGKKYGVLIKRTEAIFCPDDPGNPTVLPTAEPYRGNARVLREKYSPDDANWRSGTRTIGNGQRGRTLYRTTTTGEYSTPYAPFCKLRCAESFALAAYKAGYRIRK